MPAPKKPASKTKLKIKDMKAKKNPKGGLNFTKIVFNRKTGEKF